MFHKYKPSNNDKIMKFEKLLRIYLITLIGLLICTSVKANGNWNKSSELINGLKYDAEVFKMRTKPEDKNSLDEEPVNSDDVDGFVLVDLSEFVALVKGGLKQAKNIAQKYNLKLVKKVKISK